MKSFLSNTIVILLARIILGGLFVVASIDKIIDPNTFAVAIVNYQVVGPSLALVIATILPPLELLCGLGIFLGMYPRASAFLITTMLIVFTTLIVSALFRGLDISCGCFTQDPNASKIGYQKILENIGMIILGTYLMFVRNFGITLFRRFPNQSTSPP